MRELPILFSSAMVRALLAGKTQTRRIVKINAKTVLTPAQRKIGFLWCNDPALYRYDYPFGGAPRLHVPICHPADYPMTWRDCGCATLHPRWSIGDRLWVKETLFTNGAPLKSHEGLAWCHAATVGDPILTAKMMKKVVSIHCPRQCSRITLEVTDVRVQRVQEIGKDGRVAHDVLAEGITDAQIDVWRKWLHLDDAPAHTYGCLWDSINGNGSWSSNPWVWAITFKMLATGGDK